MERDFLGVIGKESAAAAAAAVHKEEGRSSIQDSVFYGNGSGIQWPSSSKSSPLPAFMSIKPIRDEKSDQFSISGFQPKPDNVASNPRTSTPVIPQQYPVHGYGPSVQNVNGSRVFPVMSHHSAPFTPQNNPFVKVNNSPQSSQNISVTPVKQQQYGGGSGGFNFNGHLVGSTFGVFVPRDVPKPSPTAQMTIFYAGSVCSFDNIPVDKAKEILLLASKAANVTPPTIEPPKVETIVKVIDADIIKNSNPMQLQKQNPVVVASSCPVTSSPVSIVSHTAALSRSASSSNNSDSNVTKSLSPLGPSSQPEPSSSLPSKLSPAASPAAGSGGSSNMDTGLGTKASLPAGVSSTTAAAIMPRAVPQARKASLARFLERRKERVTSTPYAKPSETGDACQSTNSLTPKSSNGIGLSRNCDDSLSLGQSNNTSYKNDAPSTELQI